MQLNKFSNQTVPNLYQVRPYSIALTMDPKYGDEMTKTEPRKYLSDEVIDESRYQQDYLKFSREGYQYRSLVDSNTVNQDPANKSIEDDKT